MNSKKMKNVSAMAAAMLLSLAVAGCSQSQDGNANAATNQTSSQAANTQADSTQNSTTQSTGTTSSGTSGASALDTAEMFSDRDLEQSADLSSATAIGLVSGKDVTLSAEGVYVLSGEADHVTVTVEAPEDAKVQIVLDGASITNEDAPAIYVKSADKVFVTSADGQNHLEVTGNYAAGGETNVDAVIFSKADLTLNGTGTLDIVSAQGNGISSKDDLKVTGGTYTIQSSADAMEANDSIRVYDGTITIDTGKDGLHSENVDDASLGYIFIQNGTLNITAADDAIRGNSIVQIDGGTIDIKDSEEGIEATTIQINDGQITLYAKNDGINASPKIDATPVIEVNGGTISVSMGSGDTDAFDANGNIAINGGTINVEATSAFDADGTAQLNGGTVTVNGEQITEITVSRGGGGGRGKRF
ncbi:carbohydrate-binding domain-containing protein [Paenibacillus sp. NFR01]|uniref:carbohydrate-binding domain-containing protein n=1 Tax=Paenibacillus sp. NFR01 TaxID=1566279 RepID=UPI0008CDE868|nr:carbohydrate-binding domain-containing protein [Paenibacillus sp. NFR01]SEU27812.1 protein of unknown function [Paenibacillus sp. NFR01]